MQSLAFDALDLFEWLMTTAFGIIVDILRLSPQEFSPSAFALVENIASGIRNFSFGLLAFFFLMDLAGSTINFRIKKHEEIIKIVLQAVLGGAILQASFWLCMLIFNNFGSLIMLVGDGISPEIAFGGFIEITKEFIESLNFMETTIVAVFIILFLLTLFGLLISCILAPIGIMFEVYIYSAFAPIPLSTILTSQKAIAINFIKTFVGVCMRGSLILLGILLSTTIITSDVLRFGNDAATGFALVLVIIMQLILNVMILQKGIKSAEQFGRGLIGG